MPRLILILLTLIASPPQLWSPNYMSGPDEGIVVDSEITFEEAMEGTSAPQDIIDRMELITIEYYGFDDRLHRGQMVIDRELAEEVKAIFEEIRELRFPIESVIPVKFDLPDNGTSMDSLNNTMGFHYRAISTFKTTKLSYHAFGRAIDINPFQNPAILRNGTVIPDGACFNPEVPGTLTRDSEVVRIFLRYGWQWGGSWRSLKDYMHFEKH